LHALGTPLAFILSQDQTLHKKVYPVLADYFFFKKGPKLSLVSFTFQLLMCRHKTGSLNVACRLSSNLFGCDTRFGCDTSFASSWVWRGRCKTVLPVSVLTRTDWQYTKVAAMAQYQFRFGVAFRDLFDCLLVLWLPSLG
jgi:hypothetical protein